MPTDPARRLERAVVDLTTQVRRIADTMTTPTDDAPTTGDDRSPEPFGYEHRDTLGILLSRMSRGVLLTDERPLLREHVEHLLADRDRLDAALDRPAAGQVDDSSHTRAAAVEDLARGLAGAAHINGRSAPWDDLTPPERARFRVEARRAHTPPADTTEER